MPELRSASWNDLISQHQGACESRYERNDAKNADGGLFRKPVLARPRKGISRPPTSDPDAKITEPKLASPCSNKIHPATPQSARRNHDRYTIDDCKTELSPSVRSPSQSFDEVQQLTRASASKGAAHQLSQDDATKLLNLAATVIQARVRGYLQRRKFLESRRTFMAAQKIQALWRGYHTRHLNTRLVLRKHEFLLASMQQYVRVQDLRFKRCETKWKKEKSLLVEALACLWEEVKLQKTQLSALVAEIDVLKGSRAEACKESGRMFSTEQDALQAIPVLMASACLPSPESPAHLESRNITMAPLKASLGVTSASANERLGLKETGSSPLVLSAHAAGCTYNGVTLHAGYIVDTADEYAIDGSKNVDERLLREIPPLSEPNCLLACEDGALHLALAHAVPGPVVDTIPAKFDDGDTPLKKVGDCENVGGEFLTSERRSQPREELNENTPSHLIASLKSSHAAGEAWCTVLDHRSVKTTHFLPGCSSLLLGDLASPDCFFTPEVKERLCSTANSSGSGIPFELSYVSQVRTPAARTEMCHCDVLHSDCENLSKPNVKKGRIYAGCNRNYAQPQGKEQPRYQDEIAIVGSDCPPRACGEPIDQSIFPTDSPQLTYIVTSDEFSKEPIACASHTGVVGSPEMNLEVSLSEIREESADLAVEIAFAGSADERDQRVSTDTTVFEGRKAETPVEERGMMATKLLHDLRKSRMTGRKLFPRICNDDDGAHEVLCEPEEEMEYFSTARNEPPLYSSEPPRVALDRVETVGPTGMPMFVDASVDVGLIDSLLEEDAP